jgi:hypothetical protein
LQFLIVEHCSPHQADPCSDQEMLQYAFADRGGDVRKQSERISRVQV